MMSSLKSLFMIFYEWTISIFSPLFPVVEKDVSGKNILITGGGSGLGQLMAVEFARRNARIILWDINQSGMIETSDLISKGTASSKCYCYTVDVSNREAVKATAEKVLFEVGDIDILINNAGVVSGMSFLKVISKYFLTVCLFYSFDVLLYFEGTR